MKQLVLYTTLFKHNTTITNLLEKLYNNSRVVYYDKENDTILLNGTWWHEFTKRHKLYDCEVIMLSLRARYKANNMCLIFENEHVAKYFTWNENAHFWQKITNVK